MLFSDTTAQSCTIRIVAAARAPAAPRELAGGATDLLSDRSDGIVAPPRVRDLLARRMMYRRFAARGAS